MASPHDFDEDDPGPGIRTYRIGDGWEVWVGRTDADNDALSIKLARPDDLWFHVRGMPGSHALLRARPGMTPDKEVRAAAAAIAAYHSKARNGGVTPVACTLARYVTKPRGAKPGTVQIRKETLIKVRPALPEATDTP